MKARIYRGSTLIAEAPVTIVQPEVGPATKLSLSISDRITVAFVEDHPHQGARPMFVHGIVERA